MQLPKKINPDRIKNAILDIRYKSNTPFEILIGVFYQAIKDNFKYINPPIQKIGSSEGNNDLSISVGRQNLFYNDFLKIQIQPNSIVFNCNNSYSGWEKYLSDVNYVLKQIFETKFISEYNRIGIRYVSEYPDIDLRGCVNFKFEFGMPNVVSSNYQFRSEFEYSNKRIILNLKNNLPLVNNKDSVYKNVSYIDIDVIKENVQITSLEALLSEIEENHTVEKEIFFTILKEDFLKILNPIY